MPRKSEWNQQLTEVIEVLEQFPSRLLDRAHIQQLFATGPRQATRIFRRLGAQMSGGALVMERQQCLDRLRELAAGNDVVFEQRRRERFAEQIEQARREIRSRRVAIPMPETRVERLAELPAEIEFRPGELRVRFSTPMELLQHLVRLSQALAEDWESWQTL